MTSSVKPRNPCQSNPAEDYLNYSAQIPTGLNYNIPPKYMITGLPWRYRSRTRRKWNSRNSIFCVISLYYELHIRRIGRFPFTIMPDKHRCKLSAYPRIPAHHWRKPSLPYTPLPFRPSLEHKQSATRPILSIYLHKNSP